MRKGSIRKVQVLERLPGDFTGRIVEHLNELEEQQEEVKAAYLHQWEEYFQQIHQAQREGKKGPIAFVCMSWLRSEILCGSHGCRLDAYDEGWYLDEAPLSSCWSCDVIWRYYEEDMAYIEKAMQKPDKPRLKEPEMQWLRMECAAFYQQLSQYYAQVTIEEIQLLESYHQLKKAEELRFLTGEYLDQNTLIYEVQTKKEEQEETAQTVEEAKQPAKAGNPLNQDYFLLKQDPGYKNTPQITNWFHEIDKRKLNRKEAKAIPEQTLFKVKTEEETECLDYLDDPFILMSQEMKEVTALYEPYMIWKEIILLDSERAESELYYLPILEKADCLSPESQRSVGKTRLLTIVLEEAKLPESSIFQLAGNFDQSYTIIRQDLIESLLRRNLTGLSIEKVQVI